MFTFLDVLHETTQKIMQTNSQENAARTVSHFQLQENITSKWLGDNKLVGNYIDSRMERLA